MTRAELINILATKQPQIPISVIELGVKTLFKEMSLALSKGLRIEIRGFGSFSLRYRQPRPARNPKTGQNVQTEGKYTPHFKPGKELRKRVNTSLQEATQK